MARLADKVVVVAGGATGIGAATARLIAGEGAKVVLGDINEKQGRVTAEAIAERGGSAVFQAFDIADEGSVKRLMDAAIDKFGRIDALFSNAADLRPEIILRDSDIVDIDVDLWHHTLAVDLTGFFYTSRHAIPHLLRAGGGPIVVTSSAAAFLADAERPAYATAKAGIGAMVRHIATRWGKEGLRCNAVAPGPVLSEVFKAGADPATLAKLTAPLLVDRMGEPEDIAAMVLFLLSDEASWITGQVIGVNGGMVVR
ncbi:MAG: SDR family oxidoreductase [Acidimicrobiaceae bacterium]|nr:SDR family oxidoreductase [Acidimicrobiaceae bacterium]